MLEKYLGESARSAPPSGGKKNSHMSAFTLKILQTSKEDSIRWKTCSQLTGPQSLGYSYYLGESVKAGRESIGVKGRRKDFNHIYNFSRA